MCAKEGRFLGPLCLALAVFSVPVVHVQGRAGATPTTPAWAERGRRGGSWGNASYSTAGEAAAAAAAARDGSPKIGEEQSGIPGENGSIASRISSPLNDAECDDYHKFNVSLQCGFIRATNDCKIDDGFVNYLEVAYCGFPSNLVPLALVLFFIWLVFLFVALGVTAEDFFCPALTAISKSLKLSQNIAGVTFLAFGNGAPDIFSAIAAITNAKNGDAGLAIGALFGAGVFVTTVVAGSVSIARPFDLAQRPFLRDAIFYIGAAFWTFYVLYTGKIWTAEAVGFILLYIAYVFIVVIGRKVYQSKIKPRSVRLIPPASINCSQDPATYLAPCGFLAPKGPAAASDGFTESDSFQVGANGRSYGTLAGYVSDAYVPGNAPPRHQHHHHHHVPGISEALRESEQIVAASVLGDQCPSINAPALPDVNAPFKPEGDSRSDGGDEEESMGRTGACLAGLRRQLKDLLRGINPIDVNDWESLSLLGKLYEVFKCPIQLVLLLTIPVVDHTEDRHCWNRLLNCLQLLLGPLFCAAVIKRFTMVIVGDFLLWELMLCVGLLLACIAFFTSRADKPPAYHFLFAYFGFFISVLWIYSIANEIVNLLQMYGTVFQLSSAILGLTLLAWGNSIGDLVSDIAVAKQGYPRMAVAACFGGPLFNMLLGIGISCTIACFKHGGIFYLQTSHLQMVLAGGLMVSLFFSLFYHLARSFKATRVYGVCLYVLYVLFLIVAILTETGIIDW